MMRELLRIAISQHGYMKRPITYKSINTSIETIPLRSASRGKWIHDVMYYDNSKTKSMQYYSYRSSRCNANSIRDLKTIETDKNPSLRDLYRTN